MSDPVRILFVCHGNICRSPMAEFVMKDLVERRGMVDRFRIASAATHDDVIGSPVHPGTREVLESQGISCDGKTARRLRDEDVEDWDLVVVMDEANVRDAKRQLGKAAKGKIHKLLEYAGTDRDVADPWWTGDFATTYDDVLAGCTGLLAALTGSMGARGAHRAARD
ncbi:low molecular weight phosphotyrosine protein phosphatase [Gordonibacter sp. 28C]|uniref:low molecular weight protein-tyrosine-phosphatase n=1 Tax=Gordonibacter sp. 28C TaxID=2078569 RepID=UPI000DF864ED|nr:low molecular weight protein-tyrosine-phosphatase [Gordonibacter sp. 28C]RDB62384.1 low molecular weight phosphotyrosine protein phosphatase [Gordonibacter sp. 28C]